MTQEEKQLLLKDLSARLPYIPIVQISLFRNDGRKTDIDLDPHVSENIWELIDKYHALPYLRPMSSMTDEEKNELKQISDDYLNEWENAKTSLEKWKLDAKVNYKNAMFYNSNHLDWNDLTSKGLALQAPEGMYKMEE